MLQSGPESTDSTGDYLPVVMHSIYQCSKPEAGRNDEEDGPCKRYPEEYTQYHEPGNKCLPVFYIYR